MNATSDNFIYQECAGTILTAINDYVAVAVAGLEKFRPSTPLQIREDRLSSSRMHETKRFTEHFDSTGATYVRHNYKGEINNKTEVNQETSGFGREKSYISHIIR